MQKDHITVPFRFTMEVDEGEAPQLYGWYRGSYLMQQRLMDALRSAGVDNLQTFAAEIVRAETGEKVEGFVELPRRSGRAISRPCAQAGVADAAGQT